MRGRTGRALDAFYQIYVCVDENGSDLQQLHGSDVVTRTKGADSLIRFLGGDVL